jgi:hypothetical protein
MPTTQLPPRPLPRTGGSDRTVRVILVVVAIAAVLVSIGGLAARSVASSIESSTFSEVPSRFEAGTPEDLTVTTDVADVRVMVTDEVDTTTLALVEPGTSSLSTGTDQVRARWERTGDPDATESVTVRRPAVGGPAFWLDDEDRDLLVAVPRDDAQDLSLRVRTSVGEVEAGGGFDALDLRSDTGDIDAQDVSTTGDLRAATDVGDIRMALAEDGAREIRSTTSTGDIDIEVPCCDRWEIDADSSAGDVDVESSIRGEGSPLVARTDLGEVRIGRR